MAGILTLVISFLARLVGLGRVSDIITNLVNRVRQPIDRGLDRIVAWIVRQARRLGQFIAQAGVPQDPNERLHLGMRAAVAAVNRFAGRRVGEAVLTPLLAAIRTRYGFRSLRVLPERGHWVVEGEVNPKDRRPTQTGTGTNQSESAFQYRIDNRPGKIVADTSYESGGGQLLPPPSEKYQRAYIGNTPTIPSESSPATIAQRYLSAFQNPQEAQQRFSLVIGVNSYEDLQNQNRASVERIVNAGTQVAYPWKVIGFLWMPIWVDDNGRPAPNMALVRQAFNQLPGPDRTAAIENERQNLGHSVPFGPIRDQIHQSQATRAFNNALRARADEVFIHVSDADTANFNPQGDGGGAPEALFQRFDRILDAMVSDVQQHQQQGERPSDGGPPIIATGGYEIELPHSSSQPDQVQDLRVQLSARLDMAVRRAMASVDPRSVYFPEPNLLIQITDQTIQASFGSGRFEARRLIENLESQGIRPQLIFDLRASIATTAPARMQIEHGQIRSTWLELQSLSEIELQAMIGNSQSHARQVNWARQVRSSYRLPAEALAPLNRLWEVYFPISRLLYGTEPGRLRQGVTGRNFTSHSQYGNDSEHRENLLNIISQPSQGRTPSESQELTNQIVELARQGGLGLADALAEMFERITSGG